MIATAFLMFGFVLGGVGAVRPAHAASYEASELIRSARTVEVAPGGSVEFTIGFKNTGTQTWYRDGLRFVSVYTHGPKYRKSVFRDATWMNDVQPARLSEAQVAPGGIGRVTFTLYAPLETGHYSETFHLAVEDTAWISGGLFTVDVDVREEQTTVAHDLGYLSSALAPGYKASKLLATADRITFDRGGVQEYRVAFKNIGRTTWRSSGADRLTLRALPGNAYSFRDGSWQAEDVVATLPQTEVAPGQLVFMTVKLAAPPTRGQYSARFVLASGTRLVEGGTIDLPIEVIQGSVPASVPQQTVQTEFSRSGPRGPDIRVGLFSADDVAAPQTFTANGPYRLLDQNDSEIRTLSGLTSVTFDPASKTYTVRNGGFSTVLRGYLSLKPVDDSTIFEITSYHNRPVWDPSIDFNKFRGTLEIFYTGNTGRLWVVEILPVEDYMRGLAETSNGSPYEYQKALVTAARTYALFILSIGGKHQREFHDIEPTAGDQVYKGYASELVRPNVVRAAEETRGSIVTYDGDLVVTPYFSRSDGRTRAWTEVWGGAAKPWLVSVPTPYDAGRSLWGHGVGLSASDAVGRADDGASWTDILKYYYQGTQVGQAY